MARFTTAEKWGDTWFSELKPLEKLIFLYLTDKCDNAGFFEINKRIDSFLIGVSESEFEGGLNSIKKCYIKSKDGTKIWLKNYLKHQKNIPLNPDNNAHKQIITFIQSNLENFEYDFNKLAPNKPLFRDLGNVIGNVIGNEGGAGGSEISPIDPFVKKKNEPDWWRKAAYDFLNDVNFKQNFSSSKNVPYEETTKRIRDFIVDLNLKEDYKDVPAMKSYFINSYNKWVENNGKSKKDIKKSSGFIEVGEIDHNDPNVVKW